MSGEEENDEKPFEATPRKLEEARKRGEVPISQDLITFGVYVGVLLAASMIGVWSVERAGSALVPFLDTPEKLAESVFGLGGRHSYGSLIAAFAVTAAVWLAFPFFFALATAGLQGALVFAPTKLQPKLSRISVISNAKQKYGPEGLFNFVKSFSKLVVYSLVLGLVFKARLNDILSLPALSVPAALSLSAELCFRFLVSAAAAIFVFAMADLLWQRARFMRRQRMSLKELKDESKETEGDPHTKQARRQRGYDIATNQMLSDVAEADVVVVNPEHYAVALTWDRTPGSAPVCVAKGVDEIAARIRETAIEHAVPIYRDPPTARALHAVVDLGDQIPADQYRAVAAAVRFADTIREKARRGI
ncbi:MAG: flagellar biosynthesis protein FlhB [Silicimonas sp.]|nr:flagellar biosynthesis protein FlhB [Silicimonas sp.]